MLYPTVVRAQRTVRHIPGVPDCSGSGFLRYFLKKKISSEKVCQTVFYGVLM